MRKKILLAFLFLPITIFAQVKSAETNDNVTQYFYDDHVPSIQIWYGADKKPDSTKTYYANGKLNEVFYYDENGLKDSNCFQYNTQGEKLVTWNFSHGKLVSRTDHKLPFSKDREETVKKALELLTEINVKTDYNPTRITDIYNRGVLSISLGNKTLALEDLKKVEYTLDKDPKNKNIVLPESVQKQQNAFKSLLYDRLASIYASLEMESFAFNYYYKAIKMAPQDLHILYNFASLLQQRKSYDLARFYLEKIVAQKPDHAQAKPALEKLNTIQQEVIASKKTFVYPNPAQNTISIENLKAKNFDFEFFDFESKSALKGKTSDRTINVIALSSGFYILKITVDGVVETFKVIKE